MSEWSTHAFNQNQREDVVRARGLCWGGGGEPLGEPPPRRESLDDRAAWRERTRQGQLSAELVDAALEQAGLRSAVKGLDEQQRARLGEAMLDQLADGHDEEIDEPGRERLTDAMIDGLIAGKRGE